MNIILILSTIFLFTLAMWIAINICSIKTYNNYIEDEVIFYLKENPSITCKIIYIDYKHFITPKIELSVKYPSGNSFLLHTTLPMFNKLWTLKYN